MYEFRFLGQFEIRQGDRVLPLKSRPAQSLLAYLLLNPHKNHRRETLAGIFWPKDTETSARANLRQLLWQIKKAMGVEMFIADKIEVQVNPDVSFNLDATQMAKSLGDNLSLKERLELLELYRGELLPGFYDEWIPAERESLGRIFDQQMTLALDSLADEQRWRDVLLWAEKWIGKRKGNEAAYRALIRAHAALGDPASAVAVYQRCAEDLHRELGVTPSQETQDLLTQISRGTGKEARTPATRAEEKKSSDPKSASAPKVKQQAALWIAATVFALLLFAAGRSSGWLTGIIPREKPTRIADYFFAAENGDGCGADEKPRFADDFEDHQALNWPDIDAVSQGFSYIEDPDDTENTVVQMLGSPNEEVGSTSKSLPENFSLRFRFRLETEASLGLGLNSLLRNHWYQIILGPPGANPPQLRRITPDSETTLRSMVDPSIGEWHLLEVSSYGDVIQIWMDGDELAIFQDPQPLAPLVDAYVGMFAYTENSPILLDDIFVCELTAPFTTIVHATGN